jgi:hypothetical protein
MIVIDLYAKFYLLVSCKMALIKEPWCTSIRDRSFMFSYLVAGLAGSALWSLSFWQTFLIASGQTNIEFYRNQVSKALLKDDFRNPYDCGWKENLTEFFNISKDYPWFFVLLPVTVPTCSSLEDF